MYSYMLAATSPQSEGIYYIIHTYVCTYFLVTISVLIDQIHIFFQSYYIIVILLRAQMVRLENGEAVICLLSTFR